MVNVPKWHHSILWEVCILTYSLIALIFISYSYVDHRWKLLLFIQIHVGYWWRVSRAVVIFITVWGHVQTVDALVPWKSISTRGVGCTYRRLQESVSSNEHWVLCEWQNETQEGGSSRPMAEVAGSLMLNRFLTCFSFPKPNSDLGSADGADRIHMTWFCHPSLLKSENILKTLKFCTCRTEVSSENIFWGLVNLIHLIVTTPVFPICSQSNGVTTLAFESYSRNPAPESLKALRSLCFILAV